MPRPTDTNTTLSLSGAVMAPLFPETLSGEESLNQLGRSVSPASPPRQWPWPVPWPPM
ncbi:hypothetical protein QNM99_08305 [Pseudomonas sp. PCH446]